MPAPLTRDTLQASLTDHLGLSGSLPVIAHVNMTSLGAVDGGAGAVVDALLGTGGTVIMPAFTYQTQIIPQVGPPDNAINYGTGDAINAKAEVFRPDLPVHPDCGSVAEALRQRKGTLRSTHPILSFVASGPKAHDALASQTRQNPLGPIAWLEAHDGAVVLLGVDQRENFSLHLAEQRAGRKTFTRWAVTLGDIEELEHIPGCMEGFNAIWPELSNITHAAQIGMARCERIPIKAMLDYVEQRIRGNRQVMLCDKPSCLSCRTREK